MASPERRIAFAVIGVAVVLVAGSLAYRAVGTIHYSTGSASFDYPANWDLHKDFGPSSGFGNVDVVVGTMAWGPCGPSDLNCHYQQRLAPGEIEVQVGSAFLMGSDLCQVATSPDLDATVGSDSPRHSTLLRLAGRPAIRTDFEPNGQDYYQADRWREWRVAFPDTTQRDVFVEVQYRNPGGADFDRDVDRLIASLVITGFADAGGGPPDCGAPFPPAG